MDAAFLTPLMPFLWCLIVPAEPFFLVVVSCRPQ